MPTINLPTSPARILLIKPSAIGDVVHTLPILNLLRLRWPKAHITWLVTQACSGLIEGHRQIDELMIFDRKGLGKAWQNPARLLDLLRFRNELRSRRFDLVIDLQGLLRSALMGWFTHAPVRLGFANAREGAPWFYTHTIPIDTLDQHAIDRYLSVTEALGCGRGPVEYVFATDDADRAFVHSLLGNDTPYAVMLPGSNWATKRWPVGHFAALVKPLHDRFGMRTVVAGGPGDSEMGMSIGGLNLCGKTTLRQSVALLEKAALVIANDSGMMHVACALNRPLITPFGPTNPVRTGPYQRPDTVIRINIPCSPCYSRTCSHLSCLKWLTPEMVLSQVVDTLNQKKPARD